MTPVVYNYQTERIDVEIPGGDFVRVEDLCDIKMMIMKFKKNESCVVLLQNYLVLFAVRFS